jgi:hypothetical protein
VNRLQSNRQIDSLQSSRRIRAAQAVIFESHRQASRLLLVLTARSLACMLARDIEDGAGHDGGTTNSAKKNEFQGVKRSRCRKVWQPGHDILQVSSELVQNRGEQERDTVSRQLRLFLRCCGNVTTPLLTPALNHAANIISRHQRRRLLIIATSMTPLTNFESLLESFLGKYRRLELLP